ncbi:MAG: c-type cytochrome [Candidatus Acidiferrum sp.]
MSGLTGVLIALIAVTIVLAGVFLVRPSITAGPTGKILAFIGLCVLPTLCIASGMSFHLQRSQQTAYCISCHSMETHGQSLDVLNTKYIPAQHFQNHLVPPDKACYTCHTNYTMYGPLTDKLKGLKYLYMEYVSTPPKTIHLDGTYSNLQCLHCHTGMRTFDENPTHTTIMGSLKTNRVSCISCHNMIHNASEVDHLKMWVDGDAPASVAAAPAKAEPAAAAAPSKAPGGGSASVAAAAGGKAIFDSHGCSACHGAAGAGASGPALTHTSAQYPPAQLTDVLKAPTAPMKAAGMVPLTLSAADMKALVSYVSSLGGTSAVSKAAPSAPAKAKPAAASATPKAASAATPPAAGSAPPAPAKAEPAATAGPSKAPAGGSAALAATAGGKAIFDSHGCSGCHGAAGAGGSGPALTHTSSQYPPAKLTAVLEAPTAPMKAAGMVPLTLNAADMKALVSYVSSLGGATTGAAAAPLSAGSVSPATATAAPAEAAAPPKAASSATAAAGGAAAVASTATGKAIFDSHGCNECHGAAGIGASGPALTHISTQYPPAKLTAVLQAPTAQMKAAGMVGLTLSAADMKALVAYVSDLGGTSAASGATPPAAGSAPPATATPSKPEPKKKGIFRWLFAPSFPY